MHNRGNASGQGRRMKELQLVNDLRYSHFPLGKALRRRSREKGIMSFVESESIVNSAKQGPRHIEQEQVTVQAGYTSTFWIDSTSGWEDRRRVAEQTIRRAIIHGIFGELHAELSRIHVLVASAGIEDYEVLDEINDRLQGIREATGGTL